MQQFIDDFDPDTDPDTVPVNVVVNDTAGMQFSGTLDNIVYFQFQLPDNVDVAKDINFKFIYRMESSESSKNVSFNLAYYVVADGDTLTSKSFTSTEDEVAVPNDSTIDILTGTNMKIPSSAISAVGELVVCRFTRDVDGATSNHTGILELFDVIAYQS